MLNYVISLTPPPPPTLPFAFERQEWQRYESDTTVVIMAWVKKHDSSHDGCAPLLYDLNHVPSVGTVVAAEQRQALNNDGGGLTWFVRRVRTPESRTYSY